MLWLYRSETTLNREVIGESGRGLPHSRTLSRIMASHVPREASWSAAVPCRSGVAIEQRDARDGQNNQLRSCRDALCYIVDWQQIAALMIVAATAGLFIRAKLRRRAFSFVRDTHCGCSTPTGGSAKGSIVFSARKGQRARIYVKEN